MATPGVCFIDRDLSFYIIDSIHPLSIEGTPTIDTSAKSLVEGRSTQFFILYLIIVGWAAP